MRTTLLTRLFLAARLAGFVTAYAVLYVVLFELNGVLFRDLQHMEGVHWVYLPAGVRLCLVLVAPVPGALGVMLGSLWIGITGTPQDGWSVAAVTAALSGGAPLLAREMALRGLGLSAQLEELQSQSLLLLAGLFGATSALLHQVWYAAIGRPGPFFDHVVAMAVGDFLGAVLLLYAARLLLGRLGFNRPDRDA